MTSLRPAIARDRWCTQILAVARPTTLHQDALDSVGITLTWAELGEAVGAVADGKRRDPHFREHVAAPTTTARGGWVWYRSTVRFSFVRFPSLTPLRAHRGLVGGQVGRTRWIVMIAACGAGRRTCGGARPSSLRTRRRLPASTQGSWTGQLSIKSPVRRL